MSMPVTESSRRIRWKAGKEDELWSYMQERLGSGANISDALKTYADRNGISWLTARWKYYRLKQERSGTTEARRADIIESKPEAAPPKDHTLETLSDFLRSVSKLGGVDLSGFLDGLASMARLALDGQSAKPVGEHLLHCEALIARAREEHQSLSRLVDEWTAAPGVERITLLADFEARLKAAIEAVGRTLTSCGEASTENAPAGNAAAR